MSAGSGGTAAPAGWTSASGAATTLVLARHGQTTASLEGRYAGRADVALTPAGEAQSDATAARLAELGVEAIVSSPLARCLRTAEAAAALAGLPVEVDDRLAETDFGRWDGLTFAEASRRDPELHGRWLGDPAIAPPDGESFAVVATRVAAALADIRATHAGRRVAVVSHVTPIKLALREGLDASFALLYRLRLDVASLCEIASYPDGNLSVSRVNDTAHLARLG